MAENGENSDGGQKTKPPIKKKRPEDFRFGPILGEGSYSTVKLACEISTGREFAMKILEKRHIVKEKKVPQVEREKKVLSRLDHPFFVKLFFTFQDPERLYFGLSVARKGELLSKIKQLGKFDVDCTRFYSAQIVSALQHLHSLNIIHRDLKPENILFNDLMQIQITDFGTAKEVTESDLETPKASSFVGTAQYVSPELLKDKQAGVSSDLWALGCIIFQMLSGKFPFQAPNEYLIFQQILSCRYELPDYFPDDAKDLITNLLQLDPLKRIGCPTCGGYDALMSHPFFKGINWDTLLIAPAPQVMLHLADNSSDDEENDDVSQITDNFDQVFMTELKKQASEKRKGRGSDESLALSEPDDISGFGLSACMSEEERERWMRKQHQSEWDYFAKGKLILKRGQLEKKRKLSVKVREFILTEGPKLLYIDPVSKEVKGEIPWSSELRTEPRSFRIFYIHTPNRTYHLIDKTNNAMKWCKKIDEIKKFYFGRK
ncbi:3-phosphoinositide-dependent protein kinase 1-like [Clavelina lepadiformis]|uniref:3-phosphoinositide-dependent protein kinase 1-like n=1 Tax=Clavelina lepadiformis TaxID=159417 RepID=UPI00404284E3